MTVTEQHVTARPAAPDEDLATAARNHLWMHFSRMGAYRDRPMPIITGGQGTYIFDDRGRRILDGLSGLFVVQVGHGRRELAEAAARQAEDLAYFPIWGYAHPSAIRLAERLATLAPGDLNRVFFTTGGGEAVETAWKVAKQYFKLTGRPLKHKVISRAVAYHGTPQGALAITGLPAMKQQFEPLTPGGFRVPNTNFYRAPEHGDDLEAFGRWAADRIEEAILFEGPDTVAAVFLEPVQNSGGCFVAPPGYFSRVREICNKYDVLLVSDEVICAFGRHGTTFACEKFGYQRARSASPTVTPSVATRSRRPSRWPTWTSSTASSSTSGCWTRRVTSVPPWRSCTTCRSWETSAATATSTRSNSSPTRPQRRRWTPTNASA